MRNESRRVAEWLSDIVRWGEKLERYLRGMSIGEFVGNEMAVDAASKCVEVIGEAANRILREAPDLQARYPSLRLREAYLARNRLSHGYFDVDRELLWHMANKSVPELVVAVKQVTFEMRSQDTDGR